MKRKSLLFLAIVTNLLAHAADVTKDNIFSKLSSFMELSNKKQTKEILEPLEQQWPNISQANKDKIVEVVNLMFDKKLRAFPSFENYLLSTTTFFANKLPDNLYAEYTASLISLLNDKFTHNTFNTFVKNATDLFSERLIYNTEAVKWMITSNDFHFKYDKQPLVIFKNTDLKCVSKAKKDSSIIYQTSGQYLIAENQWIGQGGKVYWDRANFNRNTVYADLKSYKIELKSAFFKADSVQFTNKDFFNETLLGSLEDKLLEGAKGENASYPRFDSYSKRKIIEKFEDNVRYEGGFSFWGAKFIGSGTKDEPAYFYFKRDNKPFITLYSNSFIIRKDRVIADDVSMIMLIDKDTIFHPRLSLTFLRDKKELTLFRNNEGMQKMPFNNNYHKLDMFVEVLKWQMGEPRVELNMFSNNATANFESQDFFNEVLYERIQGMDEIHPLIKIKNFVEKANNGKKTFSATDLANYLRFSPTQVRQMLMHLGNTGIISYDVENEVAHVTPKLYHYIQAKAKRRDYDVINFASSVKDNKNASIDFLTNTMRINGLDKIFLSDSQNVAIVPKEGQIIMKKNRDFDVSGKVNAGKFQLYGKEFSFFYDNFKINLNNIDSIKLVARSKKQDANGEYPLIKVKSVIEETTGELLIDNPRNKSGAKRYAEYPILNSKKPSFVYFNNTVKPKDIYDRKKVYFQLEPFSIDTLDNFTEDLLSFKGKFVSGGIFPELEEKLVLMPDYSLGFKRKTGEAGIPVYNGKGKFFNDFQMDTKGLRGSGKLQFMTATLESKEFAFFPDSLSAISQKLNIEKKTGPVNYTNVKADSVATYWQPSKDNFEIVSKNKPMALFDGKAHLTGKINLSQAGMTGSGTIDFTSAEIVSKKFNIKVNDLLADTADFKLKDTRNAASDEIAFSTKNVKAEISFLKKTGKFISNDKNTYVEFPKNQYKTTMQQLLWAWSMDDNNIDQQKTEKKDIELAGNLVFTSTHPQQDGLSFVAKKAKYNLTEKIIYADSVAVIEVADAAIQPKDGKVVIKEKAQMQTLENASMVANRNTKKHHFFNVNVTITGKNDYLGSGEYNYITPDKKKQVIKFDAISVNKEKQTYAKGTIKEDDKFTFSPQFNYKGNVELNANEPHLLFDGGVQPVHTCEKMKSSWLKLTERIDPQNISISIGEQNENTNGDKIYVGLYEGIETGKTIYPVFLGTKRNYNDDAFLQATGALQYDPQTQEYRIANKDRLMNTALPGNYMSINTKTCQVYTEGEYTITANVDPVVKLRALGNATYKSTDSTTRFNAFIVLDFVFDEKAITYIGERLSAIGGTEFIDYTKPHVLKSLLTILSKEKSEKYLKELTIYGKAKKMPEELEKTMIFADVNFKWDVATRSFISEGKIGVMSIGKISVNKYIDGKIQIIKKRSGDVINIYLKPEEYHDYYFNYQRNVMQAVSSREEFNKIITDIDPLKRQYKPDSPNAQTYQYILSTKRRVTDFLRKIEAKEADNDEQPNDE